jgi:hypothetical protein
MPTARLRLQDCWPVGDPVTVFLGTQDVNMAVSSVGLAACPGWGVPILDSQGG